MHSRKAQYANCCVHFLENELQAQIYKWQHSKRILEIVYAQEVNLLCRWGTP